MLSTVCYWFVTSSVYEIRDICLPFLPKILRSIKEYNDVFIITLKSKEAGLNWMDQENGRGEEAMAISFQPLVNLLVSL